MDTSTLPMTPIAVAPRPAPGPRPTICQLLHGLGVGGAEVLAARLARRLAGPYRFVFACLDELGTLGESLRTEGFPVHVLGRRPGLDTHCIRRLADLMRRERVDLLHAHQCTPFFYGATARLISGRLPILLTEHGRHFPDLRRRRRVVVNRLLLGRRDRVVGVGHAVRRALIDNEGIPARRVEVVHNGIDLAPFAAGRSGREGVRRELGIGPDDSTIIHVARLDPLKDHATALKALARVARKRRDARLLIVGDGPERAAIRQRIDRMGLGPHVRLLGQRSDVGRLLAAADLLLLTSRSEGIPLTLIEAMAAGLPVVSTRVGGVGEVIDDGREGLLAEAGDDAALAAHILRLADDRALRERMGALGRRRAEERFSERRMHDRYVKLYGEMLHG
jgi:N-acetyl-alpha-D-glucosaminyl L-malate synthase BshA